VARPPGDRRHSSIISPDRRMVQPSPFSIGISELFAHRIRSLVRMKDFRPICMTRICCSFATLRKCRTENPESFAARAIPKSGRSRPSVTSSSRLCMRLVTPSQCLHPKSCRR
jgi:hypothetical protein